MPNARSLSDWRLYVIVDRDAIAGRDPALIAEQAIRGGADVIQLRDKRGGARELIDAGRRVLAVTQSAGIPLIINDRPDIAVAIGAQGVHLGQDDLPVETARRILGPDAIIGKSTHSIEQAMTGASEPVSYIAVGPVFATPTKPDYGQVGLELVRDVTSRVSKPVVAIGGIDAATLPSVRAAGARCVAVVRAVCGESDPESAARALKRALI